MLMTDCSGDLSIFLRVELFKIALLQRDSRMLNEIWQDANFKALLCGNTVNVEERQCFLPLNIITEVFEIALETPFQDILNTMWSQNAALQDAMLADFEHAQYFLLRAIVFAIKTDNTHIVNDCISHISNATFLEAIQVQIAWKVNFSNAFKNRMKQALYCMIEEKINTLRAARKEEPNNNKLEISEVLENLLTPNVSENLPTQFEEDSNLSSEQPGERLSLTPAFSVFWEFDYYQKLANDAFAEFFPDRDTLIKKSIEDSEDLDFLITLRDSLSEREIQFRNPLDDKISSLIEKNFLSEKKEGTNQHEISEFTSPCDESLDSTKKDWKSENDASFASLKYYCKAGKDFISAATASKLDNNLPASIEQEKGWVPY
ncbi:hypothetical protein [Legionella cardiaca]|uniref:Uncharacterized protein n=1 Tax=Legionella cardiaca TaxID=1071983 RepID=A0ABY8AR03_9GAMM|nr:hypothetical protein [Legionella cardiaca]WED41950.1 hypothetical protein PXX05_08370 [Legionella cardiaca]